MQASTKQTAFLADLAASRGTRDEQEATAAALDAGLTVAEASRLIDYFLSRPRLMTKPAARTITPAPVTFTLPVVAEGRYAIQTPDGVKFYKVSRPTEGRWAGYTFLDAQASDEFWPVKAVASKVAILSAIAADPDALARYGRLLGVCGVCGRTLTDEASRAKGIGPVCEGRSAA